MIWPGNLILREQGIPCNILYQEMILVFTLCSNNYLAQTVALGKSLLEHNPEYTFKIGLVDRRNTSVDYSKIPYEIVEVEQIGLTVFEDMFRRYTITELNTAVKPYYFKYFFGLLKGGDKCIYLDPDILVYNSFNELEKELEMSSIVITPHFTEPINDDKFQAENDFLNSGLYNLGFIALKRDSESEKLVNWWADRLFDKAYMDFSRGMFTDQIWINFVPLYFENVSLFRHPGYNLAYWNLHERSLTPGKEVVKGGKSVPLVFCHFSGYNPLKPGLLSKYQNRFILEEREDISQLFSDYSEKLFACGYKEYLEIKCYYTELKKKIDLEKYNDYKRSVPIYKRIARGIVLRVIRLFKINVQYYTN
jgi:lipopolysaccharide biosynthesis glycosyltransferase